MKKLIAIGLMVFSLCGCADIWFALEMLDQMNPKPPECNEHNLGSYYEDKICVRDLSWGHPVYEWREIKK